MRALWVKDGIIVNVVEYPDVVPETEDGNDIVAGVTGTENVGDAFDVTDALRERRLTKMEQVIFKELFRLTNESRENMSPATPVLSAAQYRTFIKTLM